MQTQEDKKRDDLATVAQTLLRIVASLSKTEYTEDNSTKKGRQADERELTDLSDPASGKSTTQG